MMVVAAEGWDRVGHQEVTYLGATEVEHVSAPVQLLAALGSGVLVERSAVEAEAEAEAEAAPGDVDAAFAAADVQILNQDVAAAFKRLIALVRATTGDERTLVRTRLIELFELFDAADPEVVAGRRDLANALYQKSAATQENQKLRAPRLRTR